MRLLFHLLLTLLFCSTVFASEKPVVILVSDDSVSFSAPIEAFKSKQTSEVLYFNLHGDINAAPAVLHQVMQHKPSWIFALGAKAAWFAKIATKNNLDTKVVFAMVLNWQRYDLLDGQKNIVGISNDISPGTQLFNLGMLSPKVKRVGVIYSGNYSGETIVKAQDAASLLGLELVAQTINQANEFNRAWRKISDNIDAYWVLNDPVLYTMENMHWLNDRCLKEKIVCIGQSDNITKLGILLSINPDSENVGNQAAAITKSFSRNPVNVDTIRDPIGTRITINVNTAKKIGLALPPDVLSMVNEVVGN